MSLARYKFITYLIVTDCQESLRRSYELGVQVGVYRHTRDLLSWCKKRRRRVARDELMAHLCGKAVPSARMRASQSQFTKTPVKSASTTSSLARFDVVEPDLQLFHDALAVHGRSHVVHSLLCLCLVYHNLSDVASMMVTITSCVDLQFMLTLLLLSYILYI